MIGLPLQGIGAVGGGPHGPTQPAPPSTPQAESAATPQTASWPSTAPPNLGAFVATQGGLAPLLADLQAALASSRLPPEIGAVAAQVLAFGLDEEPAPTDADLQALVQGSGLFLEAGLAVGAAPGSDFKALLLRLVASLETWSGEGAAAPASTKGPPPPFAGGPVRAQPPALAGVGADTPPDVLAARLLTETRATLSRQVLMQSASTPSPARTAAGTGEARWLFELPLAGRDGRSVAQFEVGRDGRGRRDGQGDRTWWVRFSLDAGAQGPVEASLSLTGSRLHVVLWAQATATERALSGAQSELRDALQDAGLSAEVSVRPGAPPTPDAPVGRFMDTAA